jgi:hypothetical protein
MFQGMKRHRSCEGNWKGGLRGVLFNDKNSSIKGRPLSELRSQAFMCVLDLFRCEGPVDPLGASSIT